MRQLQLQPPLPLLGRTRGRIRLRGDSLSRRSAVSVLYCVLRCCWGSPWALETSTTLPPTLRCLHLPHSAAAHRWGSEGRTAPTAGGRSRESTGRADPAEPRPRSPFTCIQIKSHTHACLHFKLVNLQDITNSTSATIFIHRKTKTCCVGILLIHIHTFIHTCMYKHLLFSLRVNL